MDKKGEKVKIGVISDTHVPRRALHLPGAIFTALKDVDLILHAGDLVTLPVLQELSAVAPVEAVWGNMDEFEVRSRLPRLRVVEAAGVKIGLIHGDGGGFDTPQRALRAFAGVHCVVFGHTHRPYNEYRGKTLLFNPGSLTDPRSGGQGSYGLLHIQDGRIQGEICYLESTAKRGFGSTGVVVDVE